MKGLGQAPRIHTNLLGNSHVRSEPVPSFYSLGAINREREACASCAGAHASDTMKERARK